MNIVDSTLTAHDIEKQSAEPVASYPPQPGAAPPPVTQDPTDQFLDRLEAHSRALVLSDQNRQAQKVWPRSTQILMVSALIASWLSTLVLAVAYIRVNNHSQPAIQRVAFHVQAPAEASKPPVMDYVVVPTPPAHVALSARDGTASYFTSPPQNSEQFTAMHSSLPSGTRVRVTNVANGRSVVVRITAYSLSHKNRIINVSEPAAEELGFMKAGSARVHLELITN
jgi:hypothetical protein